MTDRTRIGAPGWLKDMNEDLMDRQRLGTLPYALPVLTVPGRRTGAPRHTPLGVLELDGARYLLGGFPAADWIRNVRAAGHGTLTVDGRAEPVRLVEVGPEEAVAVLRAWPAHSPDGVEMMRDAGVVAGTTPDALAEAVGICPVFRMESVA